MQGVGLFDGKFRQLAWITNDMDAALAAFARDYSVPRWLELRDYPIQTGPGAEARCNIALAVRGGVELELIQPLGGADRVYSQVLTDERATLGHHVEYIYYPPADLAQLAAAIPAT